MVALSLDCLTLTDTHPAGLIDSADAAGFDHISLWVQPPAAYPSALVTPDLAPECARLLSESGVKPHLLEVFDLASEEAVEAYRPALELGARLGARAALVIHYANPDRSHAASLLATFARTAAEYGLGVNLEPVAMGRTRTLAQARELIRESGSDARILVDTLHLIRSGGGVEQLRAIDPALIGYVQINDGPLSIEPETMIAEAHGERLYPGEGEFPLAELLRIMPRSIPWGLETPSRRRAQAGMSPRQQALELMAATRRMLDRLD